MSIRENTMVIASLGQIYMFLSRLISLIFSLYFHVLFFVFLVSSPPISSKVAVQLYHLFTPVTDPPISSGTGDVLSSSSYLGAGVALTPSSWPSGPPCCAPAITAGASNVYIPRPSLEAHCIKNEATEVLPSTTLVLHGRSMRPWGGRSCDWAPLHGEAPTQLRQPLKC